MIIINGCNGYLDDTDIDDTDIICTNEAACNYMDDGNCNYGTVCNDDTIECDASNCSVESSGNLNIDYISSTSIGGFQFDIEGATIISASGGAAETADLNISASATRVIAFSISGRTIYPGEGVLVVLDISTDEDSGSCPEDCGVCLEGVIISDGGGDALDATVENCTTINVSQ